MINDIQIQYQVFVNIIIIYQFSNLYKNIKFENRFIINFILDKILFFHFIIKIKRFKEFHK